MDVIFSDKSNKKDHLKTTINFIGADENPVKWSGIIPVIAVIAVAAVLLMKFAAIDRYEKLLEAQAENEVLKTRVAEDMAIIDESGDDLSKRFVHYTWSGMNDEELDRTSRVKIAELISYIGTQVTNVKSFSLSGDRVVVNITTPSLDSISRLAMEIERQEIVSSCSMPTAQTKVNDRSDSGGVDAQIVIYIKSRSEIDMDEGEIE